MLVSTNIAFAVRCSVCGSLKVHDFSLFEIFSNNRTQLSCACGQHNAIIKTKNLKSFWMEIDCFACEEKHTFNYTLKQLLKGNIITRCMDVGVEICFIGNNEDVYKLLGKYEKDSEEFLHELGYLDYFVNSQIMNKSLDRIKELDGLGLLSCTCGDNNIEMNIFTDRVELKCMSCDGIKLIYAENDEDYNNFRSKEKIVLRERSFECIDAINQTNDVNKK